ncbi:ferredoxin [Aquicoccus sp. SCR17]|nr:ferredoxin [Carideicomes alvinocaridis]
MKLATLEHQARRRHLAVLGGFHPGPEDSAPEGTGTILMLGPDEPGFWPAFTAAPEYRDGQPDPMDRWSKRVIGGWAATLGGTALFPSDGPPFAPFYSWALRTGRIHASPIRLLVHDAAGLMVSFRGALALPARLDLPPAPPSPCEGCPAPCLTACPVEALSPEHYDLDACRDWLRGPGTDCMDRGCRARRACPLSRRHGRLDAQSAFHMRAFLGPPA